MTELYAPWQGAGRTLYPCGVLRPAGAHWLASPLPRWFHHRLMSAVPSGTDAVAEPKLMRRSKLRQTKVEQATALQGAPPLALDEGNSDGNFDEPAVVYIGERR
jgi:hypothetical protein